jgi:hypothetical protein
MLLQAIIGAGLETIENFCIGSLHLSTYHIWMPRSSQYPWKALLVNWDPLSVIILFWTPNWQTMNLINFTMDCLLILTIGIASDHLVNLSMAT